MGKDLPQKDGRTPLLLGMKKLGMCEVTMNHVLSMKNLSDALVLLYIDDNFMDAEEHDIEWTANQLDDRFMCKDIEWLSPGKEIDCLGMQLFQTSNFTGFHLEKYIMKTLQSVGVV